MPDRTEWEKRIGRTRLEDSWTRGKGGSIEWRYAQAASGCGASGNRFMAASGVPSGACYCQTPVEAAEGIAGTDFIRNRVPLCALS